MKICMKLVYQKGQFSLIFPPTLNHVHPLHVENRNSRLAVDEDDYGELGLLLIGLTL